VEPSKTGSPVVDDFSLLQGGPLYRFQVFIKMALPDRLRVLRRAVILVLLTWLPLLILSLLQGQAFGHRVRVPFLFDFAANVRFLITLPLLVIAETVIDPRLRHAVKHFVRSGLVQPQEVPAFEETIRKTNRLRDGWLPFILLVIVAFGPSLWRRGEEIIGSGASNWHTIRSSSGATLSLAGWWFASISIPVYRLLLFRWVWVIIMWGIFLWRVAKLKLYCVATHPDRAAGFGFLTQTQRFFSLIAFAGSTVIAAGFANVVAYEGGTVSGLKFLMITSCVLIFALIAAPLLALTPKLFRIKEAGLFEYGGLGTTYVQDFDTKWIRGTRPENEPLIGTSDIQSLADLSNSFAVVNEMKSVLIDREVLLGLGIPVLLPMIVLILVTSPTQELIEKILKLLL
jgi:hypothetical protein